MKIFQPPSHFDGQFSDVCLISIAAICQQGTHIETRSGPGRIILFFLFLTLTFLFVSWSANIVVLLQSSSNNIKTISDLLASDMRIGAEDNVYNRYYLKVRSQTPNSRVGLLISCKEMKKGTKIKLHESSRIPYRRINLIKFLDPIRSYQERII